MAKQLGVIQYRGKLGETVGAKRAAGQKANVIRVHQSSIDNPKTLAQRSQRVKMTPAVNFYRALAHVLDHSFQGVTYGAPSHNFFMKKALLMNSGFPYVVKGYTQPAPGTYMISKGSLPSVSQLFRISNAKDSIGLVYTGDALTTVAELSNAFIEELVGVENGDQLTFIVCVYNSEALEDAQFIYYTARFVIDTASTATLADWASAQRFSIVAANNSIDIQPKIDFAGTDNVIAAFAVIVSRPPRMAGGAWQRSTEIMLIENSVQSMIWATDAAQAALDSYAAIESANSSDWYLNQGNTGGTTGATAGRSLRIAEYRGVQALYMVTNGVSRLVVTTQYTENGVSGRYIFSQQGTNSYKFSTFMADGQLPSSYVLVSTVENYFPEVSFDTNVNAGGSGSVEEQP